ncbi:MAG: Subtilisin-like protein serine protease [Candidatus Roizmanbacteria bacterium GW2011_GWC2_41_7]|uniref:Subtilisin-like protein serine protease n=1 Tax=Candidatus Roizmanbacteria bacterium GW2011_GWC2_41_7 TaxID=1618487 RepID=A0A0G1A9E6_9BACT|nr:MAG: Subtilisin-like protein serine protease [Candidatus Roizmanbacteria bacterium GW2011_GWC2_41_7]
MQSVSKLCAGWANTRGRSNSSFSTDVPLYEGENSITIVALDENDTKSQPSEPIIVSYVADGPELIIDSPEENQEVRGNNGVVAVRGLTDSSADISVNGRWVLVKSDGSFTYEYRLSEGDNEIKIVAEDSAGNQSETTRHVRYSK